MTKYKHIIFDIDGTLIDTEYAVIHSLIETVTEITGSTPQYENLKFVLGITGRKALEQLKIQDIEKGLKLWDINMKLYQHTIKPFPNIKECLSALMQKGYSLGIVTSKRRIEYQLDFEPLGLAKYFTTVICADDTHEHKPNAAPLLAYLAKANVNIQDSIYIGDSIYDIQCATNAGMDFGLALWANNISSPTQLTHCFKTPSDIVSFLSKY